MYSHWGGWVTGGVGVGVVWVGFVGVRVALLPPHPLVCYCVGFCFFFGGGEQVLGSDLVG